jgi:hypothetical protein
MPIGLHCPKCGYVRQPGDTAPQWQCPACGVAIEKYRALIGAAPIADPHADTGAEFSLGSRLAAAAPDLCTAALFLSCWFAPRAWRETLPQELAVVMFMQFVVMPSNVILSAISKAISASSGAQLTAMLIVFALYVPVAVAFAHHDAGSWAMFAFAWLLLGRFVSALAAMGGPSHAQRMRFHWFTDCAFYLLFAGLAANVRMPGFGMRGVVLPGSWQMPSQNVIAWGFLSFACAALCQLMVRRDWLERSGV